MNTSFSAKDRTQPPRSSPLIQRMGIGGQGPYQAQAGTQITNSLPHTFNEVTAGSVREHPQDPCTLRSEI